MNRERGFIYYHCERVAKISIHLRKELFPDDSSLDDRIYVGALFHDVAKGIEPHHQTGSALIRTLLQEECTGEELDDIADIIRYHNTRHQEDLPFFISKLFRMPTCWTISVPWKSGSNLCTAAI